MHAVSLPVTIQRHRWHVMLLIATALSLPAPLVADDWPQWRGPDRDGQWHETGLVEAFDQQVIARRWTAEIGAGYSGPTVAQGRVLVMDRLSDPESIERIHCFDRQTGKPLWTHSYGCAYEGVSYTAGPRASVTVHQGVGYAIGATGHIHALSIADGRVLWQRDLREDFSIRMPNWGIAGSPLIEDDAVIVQIGGDDGACVVALDKDSGRTLWQSLDDDAAYASPIAIDQAGRRVVIVWTGERVVGLAPEDGQLLWEFPFKWERWPIGIATPVVHDDLLLISEVHKGTLLLRLGSDSPSVEQVWHRRDNGAPALHTLIGTPLVIDQHIYGVHEDGTLCCLELSSGEVVWQDDTAVPSGRWATIHMVRNQDRVWMLNERGELIIARLSPQGFDEISRAKLLDPTTEQLRRRDGVTWSHPALAHRHIFARNDKELVCADLSADGG